MKKTYFVLIGLLVLVACSKTPLSTGAIASDGVYEIRTKIVQGEYSPNQLSVPGESKVRFIVDATDAVGCMKYFTIPTVGVNAQLKNGDNIFEFTAPKKGSIAFSCSMNMGRGVIRITEAV